ncbi:hypothetical protein AAV35_010590 [Salimicrobium jeotgali]|uniref:Uncharacterized protein n=1 Tax=Salimicrobium jeotgali TaxID=1230341 RepID=K2FNC5_9BACI|nr:hypothetical protein AAV35_010590 [Salimicrobium jeotgali]EKE32436.1 hypothetical protein MJ3_03337 [Salimicrobium jeotgali]MBM7695585.1 hypothetical protein [Salimicrobium jeotgali]
MFKNEKANIVNRLVWVLVMIGMSTYLLYPALEIFLHWLSYVLVMLGFGLYGGRQIYLLKKVTQENGKTGN